MAPKPRFRQQFPKTAFCGALEEASASSELGCAGLDLIRRYALHVRGSGAAELERSKKTRSEKRDEGVWKRDDRKEKRRMRREIEERSEIEERNKESLKS